MTVQERLAFLRQYMMQHGLHAFIFPSTDPHNGEYVPDHWKGREFISGFNGSAGTAVVTLNRAALWTDSRYWIAAADQLADTEYHLMKDGLEDTPSIAVWLTQQLTNQPEAVVGVDGMVMACSAAEELADNLWIEVKIRIETGLDPLAEIWHNRPEIPLTPAEIQPLVYTGTSVQEKLTEIRHQLKRMHAEAHLVTMLDDIAWTLNLRGTDVHCCPVVVSYLLITADTTTLFIDARKLTPVVKDYLCLENIQVKPYKEILSTLQTLETSNILLDKTTTSYSLVNALQVPVIQASSPIPVLKISKSDTEIQGYRSAMLKDGVALVKFLRWLLPAVQQGNETEMSIDRKLTALRAEQPLFRDISFDTIAGYQEHGAIVHYEATPETDMPLQPEGLLLLDSGAQYQDGTTDITRTIALGPVTQEQKKVYTLVLKGHIQLAMVKFPDGASGTQLDALARMNLWKEGMNYLHGTGHGVGSYLNVHEGPHQFRMQWKPQPLRAGMTITNEPGMYLAGRFGVRTENTMLITPYMETEFGKFLQLEPLTLCPIDTAPIQKDLLSDEEVAWLNDYHQLVCEKLLPLLDDEADRQWLINHTKAI